jgi:hypothetical protein
VRNFANINQEIYRIENRVIVEKIQYIVYFIRTHFRLQLRFFSAHTLHFGDIFCNKGYCILPNIYIYIHISAYIHLYIFNIENARDIIRLLKKKKLKINNLLKKTLMVRGDENHFYLQMHDFKFYTNIIALCH